MMVRMKGLKKVACLMMALAILVSSTGLTAQAADSKTVEYSKNYSFLVTTSEFSNYMSSPTSYVPSTYYYNDGVFKGTLTLTSAACSAPTYENGKLRITIFTKYSGTVVGTQSKAIAIDKNYSFLVSYSQFNSYMSSPASYVPSTSYYNDGTYAGTLSLTSAICSSPTYENGMLRVTIFTKYAGTVAAR